MSGYSRTGPRPYSLPPLRFPAATVAGETVYIIRKQSDGPRTILIADDGSRFVACDHGHRVQPHVE